MRTAPDWIALPRIDKVPASVALTAVARQLEANSDVVAEGLPEPLAGLAERLNRVDRPDAESWRANPKRTLDHAAGLAGKDAGQEQAREGSPNGLFLAALVALGLGYGLAWMTHRLGSH